MSGFEKQTYTQTPNSLFEIMREMDECELKVVLYICRMTFGYHREEIKISIRDMAQAIGMNTASVQKGAEAAEKRGLILRINEGQNTTIWRAIVETSDSKSDTVVIQNLIQGDSNNESQVRVKESINKEKEIGVSTVNYVYSENEPTVNVVDSAVNVVDSHSTPRVLEDSIKKESKTEGAAAVFTAYQDSIAMLDGHMRDVINDYLDNLHIPPQWIIEAINIAVEHNKRYWAYCAAILKRWAVEGRTDRPKQPEPSYYRRPAILDEDESKYVIPE